MFPDSEHLLLPWWWGVGRKPHRREDIQGWLSNWVLLSQEKMLCFFVNRVFKEGMCRSLPPIMDPLHQNPSSFLPVYSSPLPFPLLPSPPALKSSLSLPTVQVCTASVSVLSRLGIGDIGCQVWWLPSQFLTLRTWAIIASSFAKWSPNVHLLGRCEKCIT